jgi:hypothetical protein
MGAASTSTHSLKLQALPARARYLIQCSLMADDSVSVLGGEVLLRATCFTVSTTACTVPYFFTANQDTALALIRADSNPAYHAIDFAELSLPPQQTP